MRRVLDRRNRNCLRSNLVAEVNERDKSEHHIQNEIRNALVDECNLFRANVGVGWQGVGKAIRSPYTITVTLEPGDVLLKQARPFDTGLPPGFADTFGWVEVEITPEMVGTGIPVFLGIEVKSQTGPARDAQIAFVNAVNRAGGRAGFARSVEDALDIVRGNHARINLQSGAPAHHASGARKPATRARRTAATGEPRPRSGFDRR